MPSKYCHQEKTQLHGGGGGKCQVVEEMWGEEGRERGPFFAAMAKSAKGAFFVGMTVK